MLTTRYTNDTLVSVYPFARQPEGPEVVIGRIDTGVFLSVPAEAAEVLDQLAEGKTVGEARDFHFHRYGESPDMEDFLGFLESKGLVWPAEAGAAKSPAKLPVAPELPRYDLSRKIARWFFGPFALGIYGALALLALGLILYDPAVFPGRNALFFQDHRTFKVLVLVAFNLGGVAIHEMAHLVTARAAGAKASIGISNRLWILVAETDMTGLWLVPKRKRYIPFLAGPIVDLASASVIIILLFADARSGFAMPALVLEMFKALAFSCMMRLLWQCFFFVRTDFYYVITSLFNCKSLLKDTENLLRNQLARLIPSIKKVDQSAIPLAERRVIRAYAPLWFLGRILAFTSLFLVTLPLAIKYFVACVKGLSVGYGEHPAQFLDALALLTFSFTPMMLGLTLWIRSLVKRSRR